MKHVSMLTLSLCLAMGVAAPAAAQMQSQAKTQTTEQTQERVYGSELMTPQERSEYQSRMRAAKLIRSASRSGSSTTSRCRSAPRRRARPRRRCHLQATGRAVAWARRGKGMGPGESLLNGCVLAVGGVASGWSGCAAEAQRGRKAVTPTRARQAVAGVPAGRETALPPGLRWTSPARSLLPPFRLRTKRAGQPLAQFALHRVRYPRR